MRSPTVGLLPLPGNPFYPEAGLFWLSRPIKEMPDCASPALIAAHSSWMSVLHQNSAPPPHPALMTHIQDSSLLLPHLALYIADLLMLEPSRVVFISELLHKNQSSPSNKLLSVTMHPFQWCHIAKYFCKSSFEMNGSQPAHIILILCKENCWLF